MRIDPILDRFFSKVIVSDDHHIWTGAVSSSGHGVFYIKDEHTIIGAHVFAYEFYYGVEAVNDVHHTCEVKLCVKKEHLVDKTRSEHLKEHHKFCKRGHNLSEVGQTTSGACKVCRKICNSNYNRIYGKALR